MRRFTIKLLNWEYWPQWVVYLPLSVYYLYLSARAQSFFFFSATNPGIECGGMFFESKWKVLQGIPQQLYPNTILVNENEPFTEIETRMAIAAINYPIVAKPDRGERGWLVKRIFSSTELQEYHKTVNVSFLIQSYIDYPIELSVFYIRYPNSLHGKVSSVTYKKLLSVTGDGTSTLKQLILSKDRAYLQKEVLFPELGTSLNNIPKEEEEILLVPYGNHVRGAEFQDFSKIIDRQLGATFDSICEKIHGFYYGRFDLRTSSIENLKEGRDIAILELNGAGAEPAHIYDPSYKYIRAQKDLFWHYRQMFEIAMLNKLGGAAFMSLSEYRTLKKLEKQYKKMA